MSSIRVAVVLPQPWREFVTSIIRSDDRIELVGAYGLDRDPIRVARRLDADFLITIEGTVGTLDRDGSRPTVVLVEPDGRNGRLLRFLPESEPIGPLSAERLVSSLTASSTA